MDKNFILTKDRETATTLQKLGFQIVQTAEKSWLFLNDSNRINFDDQSNLKFSYTNKMCF